MQTNFLPKVHVAILRKFWRLTEKILAGEKTIESRWYKNRSRPWNNIDRGDVIYFKNSGEPVTIEARVAKVLQFEDLGPVKIRQILDEFGVRIGFDPADYEKYLQQFQNKNYCLLVFLKGAHEIPPFEVDKKGFGVRAAWLTVDNIKRIRRR